MSRVKRGTTSNKRRKNILSLAKGYRFGRSKKEREARVAIYHAGQDAFGHRRDKKGDFRRLWQTKISASARSHGTSYSKLMGALKSNQIVLDRKILADLAEHHPETFKAVVERSQKTQ
jgi:large subunit ribosomal protein L20